MRMCIMEVGTMTTVTPENAAVKVFNNGDHATVGLKAFFNLMDRWGIKNTDAATLLGKPKKRTFYNWKMGKIGSVPADTMSRIGYIFGIHKDLRILFDNPENVYGWINRENSDFGGQSPIGRMLAGDVTDLAYVRQYLDAMRGGWA